MLPLLLALVCGAALLSSKPTAPAAKPPSEAAKRRAWCAAHKDDAGVSTWLDANPPPKAWRGSRLEWAYLEMPQL